jgi:hypothetical protein
MNSELTRVFLTALATLVLAVCGIATIAQQPARSKPAAVLLTRRMCCEHESGPAIKEMSKISGIGRVVADHQTRTLIIFPKDKATPSALAIWEAAERTRLEPARLTMAQGVHNSKPRR